MSIKRPFSEADWQATPEPVRRYVESLEQRIEQLENTVALLLKRVEQLESQLKQNSQNSNKPPSSDPPYQRPERESRKSKRRRGGQKGHKGHRQQMLRASEVLTIEPSPCACGCTRRRVGSLRSFYTHQWIELPEIQMHVKHVVLKKGQCSSCGRWVKAQLPKEYQTGYGPRFSALVAELSGIQGISRQAVEAFVQNVFEVPISTGAIQNVIDRVSEALSPVHAAIGASVRSAAVNHVDETSWQQAGAIKWLWTMTNYLTAFFMVHSNRSQKAFEALIDNWRGILISDNYAVYRNWVNHRQVCLAHLIRKAKGLSERADDSCRRFGDQLKEALQQLCAFAHAPPGKKKWTDFYTRLMLLLWFFEGAEDDAGRLAREILREIDTLWVFLDETGVEPTNNRAERALRFAVLWRKRSNGTQSEKGNRWVERLLSFRQTCRLRKQATFPLLVDTVKAYFKEQTPNLGWLG
jgi:transposase